MTEQAKPVDPIAHLTALAEELFSVEADVARLNEELKTAQRRAQSLTEHEIPEAMDTAGVQDITTMSGLVIEVKDEVKAGDLKKPTGLDWLRTIGEAGCIKTAVTVPFATGSENAPAASMASTRKRTRCSGGGARLPPQEAGSSQQAASRAGPADPASLATSTS